jgi:hypothetical protein
MLWRSLSSTPSRPTSAPHQPFLTPPAKPPPNALPFTIHCFPLPIPPALSPQASLKEAQYDRPGHRPGSAPKKIPSPERAKHSPNTPLPTSSRRLWTAGRITALRAHGVRAARSPLSILSQQALPTSHFPLLTSHFPAARPAFTIRSFPSNSSLSLERNSNTPSKFPFPKGA